MPIEYSPSVVHSGLVLCLDAANPRSYPGTGANWYDISGQGNHHTLIASPTYASGKFTLDGSTQGISRSAAMTGVSNFNTVVIWYSTTDAQELWTIGQTTSFYLSASTGVGNNYYHAACGAPTNYVDLVSTVNPATPTNYRNGAYHMWEAKNVDFTTWTSYGWFNYGAPGAWCMAGSVAQIAIYNRPLLAEESAQNFQAFRGRYGI